MNEPPRRSGSPFEQSGIFTRKTGFLRLTENLRRPRKLPRPSRRTILTIFGGAALLSALAGWHRSTLERRFAMTVRESAAMPFEIKKVRAELADLEEGEKSLGKELDARLQYVQSLKSEDFYLVLDSAQKHFRFQYGDKVVRDGPAQPGPARTIEAGERRWTFPALSGAYSIREKLEDADWSPPAWVYAMNGVKPPASVPEYESGLGRFVIVLGDDAIIHSPPSDESPLKGPKPGSFQMSEADLGAIWKRIGPRTRVYVF